MTMQLLPEPPDFIAEITIGHVLATVVFIVAAYMFLMYLRKLVKPIQDFLDDWNGTKPRPGVEAKPGVMERLQTLEDNTQTAVHELRPNSGKSLHDQVIKIRKSLVPDDELGERHVD